MLLRVTRTIPSGYRGRGGRVSRTIPSGHGSRGGRVRRTIPSGYRGRGGRVSRTIPSGYRGRGGRVLTFFQYVIYELHLFFSAWNTLKLEHLKSHVTSRILNGQFFGESFQLHFISVCNVQAGKTYVCACFVGE